MRVYAKDTDPVVSVKGGDEGGEKGEVVGAGMDVDDPAVDAVAAETRSGAATPREGEKQSNAPQWSLSAYMIFAGEQREKIKEENPGVTFGMDVPVSTSRSS